MAHGPPTVAHPRSSARRARRPRPWAAQPTGASAHRWSRRRPPPAAAAAAKASWRSLAVVRADGGGVGGRRRRRQTPAQTGWLTKTKKPTSVSLPVQGCTQPPSTHRFATRRRWPHRFACLPRRCPRDGTPAERGGRCRRCATAAAAWAHPQRCRRRPAETKARRGARGQDCTHLPLLGAAANVAVEPPPPPPQLDVATLASTSAAAAASAASSVIVSAAAAVPAAAAAAVTTPVPVEAIGGGRRRAGDKNTHRRISRSWACARRPTRCHRPPGSWRASQRCTRQRRHNRRSDKEAPGISVSCESASRCRRPHRGPLSASHMTGMITPGLAETTGPTSMGACTAPSPRGGAGGGGAGRCPPPLPPSLLSPSLAAGPPLAWQPALPATRSAVGAASAAAAATAGAAAAVAAPTPPLSAAARSTQSTRRAWG